MSSEPVPVPLRFPARPIPLKASLRRPALLPEYLPARMLNEFVYCPRLFFYEWVEGVFAHSADTVEGALRHEKLGNTVDALPPPGDPDAERIHARSVTLTSDVHRLIATIDLVDGDAGVVSPVDYKHGAPREGEDGLEAWPADRAQVCAQAVILRENGYRCDEAVLYYNATKQRVRVPIEAKLVAETLDALRRARDIATRGAIPPRSSTVRNALAVRWWASVCPTRLEPHSRGLTTTRMRHRSWHCSSRAPEMVRFMMRATMTSAASCRRETTCGHSM